MLRFIVFISLVLSFSTVNAQFKRYKKTKVTYGKRTLFGYVGLNRTYYSKTSLHFIGPHYDFSYDQAQIVDQPAPLKSENFLTTKPVIAPQISAKVGYYFAKYWAVCIGYEHFTYNLRNKTRVFKYGIINPEAGEINYGKFDGAENVTDTSQFNYQNKGMQYWRLEFLTTTNFYKSTSPSKFAYCMDIGIGAGPVTSKNTFKFAGQTDVDTKSLSGFGVSLHMGNRFELKERMFFGFNMGLAYINQNRVRTRSADPYSYSEQQVFLATFNLGLGFFLYGRPVNECGTCPGW